MIEAEIITEEHSFAERWFNVRRQGRLLVFGADPSEALLRRWGLSVDAAGIDTFIDIVLDAIPENVGVIKPQSAFFEARGWQGMRSLERLIREARAMGALVLLDAKRGDIGSTADAYGSAYLGTAAPLQVDAITVAPYLGLDALTPMIHRAAASGSAVFVVARSSNPEGRALQTATLAEGVSVENALLRDIGRMNEAYGLGTVNAVVGVHTPPLRDEVLRSSNALFLCPGFGAQGTTAVDIATAFRSVADRVLPTASRSLLDAGPDPKALADRWATLNEELAVALASV